MKFSGKFEMLRFGQFGDADRLGRAVSSFVRTGSAVPKKSSRQCTCRFRDPQPLAVPLMLNIPLPTPSRQAALFVPLGGPAAQEGWFRDQCSRVGFCERVDSIHLHSNQHEAVPLPTRLVDEFPSMGENLRRLRTKWPLLTRHGTPKTLP